VGGASTALAGMAASRLTAAIYKKVRRTEPPANLADPDTSWAEAIVWAAVSGLAVGLGRLAAERVAARGWVRATGALPPGMTGRKSDDRIVRTATEVG